MCGFAGVISKGRRPVPKGLVEKMGADIFHRGPDDHGYWFSHWCGLSFRRLAIIDLSDGGHQPMPDLTGRYIIVYNGELYNCSGLRKALQSEGVAFRSSSDTEVVLQAYIRWGRECLGRFLGMFAFLIIDTRAGEVFAARDHLGIKPLYYSQDKDYFYVSSEIKSLRHVMRFEINPNVLYEQFFFNYVAGPSTPFKNIHKCLPGMFMTFARNGPVKQQIYYDVTKSLNSPGIARESEFLPRIEAAIKESILSHTMSDVGFNVQLSGGVDSSYITAILAKHLGFDIETFSISVNDEECDESEYQRMVSRLFSTRHHEIRVNDLMLADSLEKATWHMDIPVVHLGSVFLMLLCRQSGTRSRVILTGEGADELFGGYSRYLLSGRNLLADKMKPEWLKIKSNGNSSLRAVESQFYFEKRQMMEYFKDLPQELAYRIGAARSQSRYRSQMLAHDQKCYLVSLLERQDKMSMASSVEARVPFCNHVLFEMVNPVSERLKFRGNMPKYILKKLGEKYLDRSLLYRRKNGLNLPINRWMSRNPLSERLDILTDRTARERGFYNMGKIENAISRQRAGTGQNAKCLFPILLFETWMRMFIDNPFSYKA